MGTVTFEMLVKIDGLNTMSTIHMEALLDEIIGNMNAKQIREWLRNAKYRGEIISGINEA